MVEFLILMLCLGSIFWFVLFLEKQYRKNSPLSKELNKELNLLEERCQNIILTSNNQHLINVNKNLISAIKKYRGE